MYPKQYNPARDVILREPGYQEPEEKDIAMSRITGALENAFNLVRELHPDVKHAIFTVYLHPRGDRRGHFWQNSWRRQTHKGESRAFDEIHISSHILHEGAISIMRTLVHEAVHSHCAANKIQEVSRQGRYHNKEFRKLAEEWHLICESDPKIGTRTVGITKEGLSIYAKAIETLEKALVVWQDYPGFAISIPGLTNIGIKPKKKGTKSGYVKMVCPGCGLTIRTSRSAAEERSIICGDCELQFEMG